MNSDTPSNDHTKGYVENYSWVDFFDIVDKENVLREIGILLGDMSHERLKDHLMRYHLQGYEDMIQNILKKDLSNVFYG